MTPRTAKQTAFLVELDGLHTIHPGEIGHLTEEKLADIGSVDIACVPIGGLLTATKTAELVAQLDPKIVVAMPLEDDTPEMGDALAKFFHEMGGEPAPQPRLSVTISSLGETTAVLPESRARLRRQARSKTTRPRLTTVRTRSAAGQYGICRRRHAPDHEVGGLAALDRPDVLAAPDREGGVDRDRGQSLVRGQPRFRQATVIASGNDGVGDVPGLSLSRSRPGCRDR